MRKLPFFFGLFLLIFPLNWIRLLAFGQFPAGNDPNVVLLLSAGVAAVALLLIYYGLPALRQTGANVVAEGGSATNVFTRLVAAIRDAHQRSVQQRLEEQKRREAELEHARNGQLSPIDPGTVVLQSGENAFASIQAALVELRTVGYTGRSTGISVRVAKGVWLRQSGSRGTPDRRFVPVARGALVATNRRLVFAGDQKSVAVPYGKISSFEPMKDGLRFGDGRKSFSFLTGASQQQQVFLAVADRLLRERLN